MRVTIIGTCLAVVFWSRKGFLDSGRNRCRGSGKKRRLQDLGIKVLRFWDEEIYHDIDNVLRAIETTVLDQKEKARL